MARTTDIVVYVRGGNVQGVSTNVASSRVRVVLVDFDNGHDVDPENIPADCAIVNGDIASVGSVWVTNDPTNVKRLMKFAS